VDHGDTACKTPDAVSYIEKMWARKKEREAARPAAKAGKPAVTAKAKAAKLAKKARPAKTTRAGA
jgi:hypothetical protein